MVRRVIGVVVGLAGCGPSIAIDDATGVGSSTSGVAPATSVGDDDGGGATDVPTIPPDPDDTGVASTGSAADGNDGVGDDEGCAFLDGCGLDAGAGAFECDIYTQDCPRGEKCMPWANDGGPAWNATRCSPMFADPGQVGEPCHVEGSGVSGIDDCDVGLMCWNVDENGIGTCEDMCTGSAEAPLCENPGDICTEANDGVIALCLESCHPLLQDCAIQGEICVPFDDEWRCAPDCGCEMGVYGDPCEFINACDQGNACIVAEAFSACAGQWGCCSRLCDLDDASSDALCQSYDPAQTCAPWYAEGQAPVGYANVGVCMIE